MLPKLHEEAMALPSEEEYAERKRPEQPALATFAMPDVPPAPTPVEPAVSVATAKKDNVAAAQPAQPGLFSRFLNALKQLFSGEETKTVETAAPKAEEKRSVSRIVASHGRTTVAIVTNAATPVITVPDVTAARAATIIVVTVARRSSKMRKRAIPASRKRRKK